MYLDLETVKKHLLVDSTFTDDDSYITELIQVAENAVEVNLGIALKELEDGEGNLPHSITHAMLLMVCYQCRVTIQLQIFSRFI